MYWNEVTPRLPRNVRIFSHEVCKFTLYYRWYGENVRATMRYVRLHTPKQVRRLRETQDMMEFGMIIRFLCHDHETYDKSLAYVLNEMPLPGPNFTMKI